MEKWNFSNLFFSNKLWTTTGLELELELELEPEPPSWLAGARAGPKWNGSTTQEVEADFTVTNRVARAGHFLLFRLRLLLLLLLLPIVIVIVTVIVITVIVVTVIVVIARWKFRLWLQPKTPASTGSGNPGHKPTYVQRHLIIILVPVLGIGERNWGNRKAATCRGTRCRHSTATPPMSQRKCPA